MFRKPFILLFFLLFSGLVAAASDPLYEVVVPVPDHSEEKRNAALREGLATIFDRLSGREGSLSDRSLAPVLRNPTRFIDQFSYQSPPEGLRIWMKFDPNSVNDALRERGRPIVDNPRIEPPRAAVDPSRATPEPSRPPAEAARPTQEARPATLPTTLTWLLLRQGAEVHILASGEGAEEAALLEEAARERALPVRLPLLDLEELSRLREVEVWSGGDEQLFALARRYEAGAVLIGRLEAVTPGQWRGRWSARAGGENQSWESGGAGLREALTGGLDPAVGFLKRRFAPVELPVPAGASGSLEMRVSDVLAFSDFNRVRDYLRGLPGVAKVQTLAVEPNAMSLRLTFEADPARLLELISTSGVLEPVRGGGGGGAVEFRLVP